MIFRAAPNGTGCVANHVAGVRRNLLVAAAAQLRRLEIQVENKSANKIRRGELSIHVQVKPLRSSRKTRHRLFLMLSILQCYSAHVYLLKAPASFPPWPACVVIGAAFATLPTV